MNAAAGVLGLRALYPIDTSLGALTPMARLNTATPSTATTGRP